MRESGRTATPIAHKRLSGALVFAEIAMSFTLLIIAGLSLKSFMPPLGLHMAQGTSLRPITEQRQRPWERLSWKSPKSGLSHFATATKAAS
jgi:hypothetical protein